MTFPPPIHPWQPPPRPTGGVALTPDGAGGLVAAPVPKIPPKTIQDAKAEGKTAGDTVSVPLAPPTGPITAGVAVIVPKSVVVAADGTKVTIPAKEPMVAVALKTMWTSPTMIWLRRLVYAAFGLAFLAALKPYVLDGKDWATLTIASVWPIFIHAFEAAFLSAIFAYLKTHDNNPIQGSAPK